MICTITARFVKVFAKAIHCLAKIGDELYVEALPKGLSLRTVNSARSAYACSLFLPAFFHIYDLDAESVSSTQDYQQKCKIAMKVIAKELNLGTFRWCRYEISQCWYSAMELKFQHLKICMHD
jgi:hypothetical protein